MVLPPAAVSLDEAEAAIELWEFYKGRTLDPWQRLSVQIKMATRADGRWAARTTGEEVPRQAGKGDAEEVVELWGLTQRAERILHTIHDAVLLATEAHTRLLSTIEGNPDLRRLKARAWSGTGQQMIEMRNGGIVWYRTRTGSGGAGVDEVDRIVVDEAQYATAEQIEVTSPTQLASENPQTNAMGTGGLEDKSAWWWRTRKRALLPNPGEFAYLGFTAELLSVVDGKVLTVKPDVSTVEKFLALVAQVHPTLRRRPDLVEFFAEEYRKLGPEGAAREYLLFWDPEPDEAASAIPRWDELGDKTSTIASGAAWSLTVSPVELGTQWSCFGLAGRRTDDRFHVEAIDHRAGTWWAVDRAKEIQKVKRLPLRMRTTGAEGALIEQMRAAGVNVTEIGATEYAQSCGAFIAAAGFDDDGRPLMHHLADPDLTRAVRNAARRASSNGSTTWDELGSQGEITPLTAVSLAFGGVPAARPRNRKFLIPKEADTDETVRPSLTSV